jgi:hypothetical protein
MLGQGQFNMSSKNTITTVTFNLFWQTRRYATVCAIDYWFIFLIADHLVLLLKDVQIYRRESSSAFKLHPEGWVLRRDGDGSWRRMCWLPYKRRNGGEVDACSGQKIVITASFGLLTILDFSRV